MTNLFNTNQIFTNLNTAQSIQDYSNQNNQELNQTYNTQVQGINLPDYSDANAILDSSQTSIYKAFQDLSNATKDFNLPDASSVLNTNYPILETANVAFNKAMQMNQQFEAMLNDPNFGGPDFATQIAMKQNDLITKQNDLLQVLTGSVDLLNTSTSGLNGTINTLSNNLVDQTNTINHLSDNVVEQTNTINNMSTTDNNIFNSIKTLNNTASTQNNLLSTMNNNMNNTLGTIGGLTNAVNTLTTTPTSTNPPVNTTTQFV